MEIEYNDVRLAIFETVDRDQKLCPRTGQEHRGVLSVSEHLDQLISLHKNMAKEIDHNI